MVSRVESSYSSFPQVTSLRPIRFKVVIGGDPFSCTDAFQQLIVDRQPSRLQPLHLYASLHSGELIRGSNHKFMDVKSLAIISQIVFSTLALVITANVEAKTLPV